MAFIVETMILLILVIYLLYRLTTKNHDYWEKRGVVGPTPIPIFGTQKDLILSRKSAVDFFNTIYKQFPNAPYVGLMGASNPNLLIRDPEIVKHILIKDFEFFPDRGVSYDEKRYPLSANLFTFDGVRWKNLRIKMTPTFTSGKIKRMFPLMLECSRELQTLLNDRISGAGGAVEVSFKDTLGRFSTDVIGTCAFGIHCNTLKDPNSEFRRQAASIFEVSLRRKVREAILTFFPKAHFIQGIFKNATFEEFFIRVLRENLRFRQEKSVKRNDFLDLLIELKNRGKIVDDSVDIVEDPFLKVPVSTSSEELKFSDDQLAAQSFVFFGAGFETSSSAMSFCLLELAHNPDVQKKLQDEIDSVLREHENISYDALAEMTYLDKVLAETLRKYPPLPVLTRRANRPYQVPGSKLVLEAGTRVLLPAHGLHYDPAIYPEPERFDPERFTPEAKAARHSYTYLPFGEGPRICIGMRFGLLQSKLGLASVLSRCSVEPSPRTRYPVTFKKGSSITAAEDDINLTVRNRVRTAGLNHSTAP